MALLTTRHSRNTTSSCMAAALPAPREHGRLDTHHRQDGVALDDTELLVQLVVTTCEQAAAVVQLCHVVRRLVGELPQAVQLLQGHPGVTVDLGEVGGGAE